jgi:MFS family permease
MNLAVYLAAPFFSAYMLRSPEEEGLGWSYVTFTLVQGIAVFFKFVFLPLWGRSADVFGSRKCLVLSAWIVSTLPLFWLVPGGPGLQLAMIALAQTWGGFAWAGHELCSFHFLLDSAKPAERPRLVASMNILNGFMVFLGSGLGAVAVSVGPASVNSFLLVFFLSGAARFAVCALFVRRLREVRVVEKISYRSLFFRVSSVRASAGPVLRFFVLPARAPRRPKSVSPENDSHR